LAFGQRSNYRSGPQRGGNFTSVRLTGMFATKKPGLLVGTVEGESLDGLIAKIKECVAQKKGLTLFFREVEQPKGNYVAQVFADVDTRSGEDRPIRKPIQDDPQAEAPRRIPAKQEPTSYDPFSTAR